MTRGEKVLKELLRKLIPKEIRDYRIKLLYKRAKKNSYSDRASKGEEAYRGEYLARQGKRNIYLIGIPDHANLGDHAIAEAEIELIDVKALGYDALYEITIPEYDLHEAVLKKYVNKEDIILLHGGGYMGVEWYHIELMLKAVVGNHPGNRIVMLPQTVHYEDSLIGNHELRIARKIYNRHKDFHLFAREQGSYDKMMEYFPSCNVYLVPDMVLHMDGKRFERDRDGVLLCLRADPEKSLSDADVDRIYNAAKKESASVEFTDTVLDREVDPSNRKDAVDAKLRQFSGAKLVITDRLHGMVFCAITGTPCIAFSNYNHKVSGVYEWVKDLDYITYMDGTEGIEDKIYEMMNTEFTAEYRPLRSKFQIIADVMENK